MGLTLYNVHAAAGIARGAGIRRFFVPRDRAHRSRLPRARRRTAFLLIELITGLAILAMLLAVVASITSSFERASSMSLARHRASLTAQARLEEIRAGLAPLVNADATDEDEGRRVIVAVEDAPPAWAPLKLVTVTVEFAAGHGRTVRVTARGCVAPPTSATEPKP